MAILINAHLLNLYGGQGSCGSKKFDSQIGEVSGLHCNHCETQWIDFLLLSLKSWKQYLLYRKLYFLNHIFLAVTPPLFLNGIPNLPNADVIAAR